MTKVTVTTPTEMGVTKHTSGTMSVEQYSKRIGMMHTKRPYIGNETCYDAKLCSGEKLYRKITRFLEVWIRDSPLKSIALKAIHVMQELLLVKIQI